MVMIFGGVNFGAGAVKPGLPVVPPIHSLADVSIANPATTHIAVGDTLQLTCITDPAGCAVTWSSNDTNIATVDENTGEVTGINAGTVTITAIASDPIVSSFKLTDTIIVTVLGDAGILDEVDYYIMNCVTNKLLGRANSTYTTDTDVSAVDFSNQDFAKWKTYRQSDKTYYLKNMNGPNGNLYLGINGSEVNLSTNTNKTKFVISRAMDSAHEGLYLISSGNKYVASNSTSDVYLTTTLTENCYWSFMSAVKGNAYFYGLNYSGFNTYEKNGFFTESFDALGYNEHADDNVTYDTAFDSLCYSDVFIYSGHGLPGAIYFYDSNGEAKGSIGANSNIETYFPSTSKYIDSQISNLDNSRVVIYMACHTGKDVVGMNGKTYNLVDSTFEKGAHFVLGTTVAVSVSAMNKWFEIFFTTISNENISDYGLLEYAINAANNGGGYNIKIRKEDPNSLTVDTLPTYSRGETNQYLAFN